MGSQKPHFTLVLARGGDGKSAPRPAGPAATDTYFEGEAAAYRAGDDETLARIVDRRLDSAAEKRDRLLIYVDQWEELYVMAPAPEEKERLKQHSADVEKFIELLVASTSSASSRASVVLTARADFYNPLIRNPLLAALLPCQQVNIPPMSRDDLKDAIRTPAKMAGLSFDPPNLVDRVLDDVGLEEGRLPLLQFALKETSAACGRPCTRHRPCHRQGGATPRRSRRSASCRRACRREPSN